MEVNCEGCAGCCVDWSPLADGDDDESIEWIGGTRNYTPLRRPEIREFVTTGVGDALSVVLVGSEDGDVTVDGTALETIDGRPLFEVVLRKAVKPVAPAGADPTWLETCAFLDPETLRCRIHDDDRYPENCAVYPGDNLAHGTKTECERIEERFGGDRLFEDEPPDDLPDRPTGIRALGRRMFTYPSPGDLTGVVDRLREGRLPRAARAEFVAVAAATEPESFSLERGWYDYAREQVMTADSWVGAALDAWDRRADDPGEAASDPDDVRVDERALGAPATSGWE